MSRASTSRRSDMAVTMSCQAARAVCLTRRTTHLEVARRRAAEAARAHGHVLERDARGGRRGERRALPEEGVERRRREHLVSSSYRACGLGRGSGTTATAAAGTHACVRGGNGGATTRRRRVTRRSARDECRDTPRRGAPHTAGRRRSRSTMRDGTEGGARESLEEGRQSAAKRGERVGTTQQSAGRGSAAAAARWQRAHHARTEV
jgi:hypothetical protein